MHLIIGCDNAAWQLKKQIIEFLQKKDIVVDDIGCDSEQDQTYYPLIAKKVCDSILESNYQRYCQILFATLDSANHVMLPVH